MKKIKLLFLVCFIFVVYFDYGSARLRDDRDEKFDKLRMTPKTFDKMKNLHKNTYYTAVKAIIGKMGSILFKELPKTEKRFLARCLDKIEDRRELISSAKCVVIARKRLLKIKSKITQKHLKATTQRPNQNWKSFLQQFDDFDRLHSFSQSPANITNPKYRISKKRKYLFSKTSYNSLPISKRKQENGLFRDTEASSIPSHQLATHQQSFIQSSSFIQEPPRRKGYERFNFLSKKLTVLHQINPALVNNVRRSKPKKEASRRFQKFMYRAKRSAFFSDSKDHYYKENKYKVVTKSFFDGFKPTKEKTNIISSITNVILEFASSDPPKEKGKEHLKWTKTYKRLERVRKAIDESKTVPGAKVYEHRIQMTHSKLRYDLVLDREEASLAPSERMSAQGIMHESMKLLGRLTATNNESLPYSRTLSPRFMPLMPLNEGKRQPDTYLSPTIMAMYDEPNKTNEFTIGNVPSVMKTLGIAPRDRNKIMQLVMDISGSNTHVDEALKIYETLGMFDDQIGEPILNATEKIMGAFKRLEKTLFPDQKFLYDNRGFAFIKKHQMETLLRDQGIPEGEIDLADFDIYDQMTDEQMEISLWKTIENIANNKTDVLRPSQMRFKREYLFILKPTILSPLLFTVQFGAVVLGPLILSPSAFAPPILNPSVLAPWILSPGIFDPFILSPYIFGPFILGPFGFTPFVLTPYFLSPNILNPYLITSLILSPLGLCPDILSPMAIGANILSPSILSPPVLNPTVLTASVLSPSFLS